MKNLKLLGYLMVFASALLCVQCTSDPIPGPPGADGMDGMDGQDGQDGVSTGAGTSTTDLLAKRVLNGPLIDGVIDATWADAQVLIAPTEVLDPLGDDGTQAFRGYVGQTQESTLRALYDDEYIYFLAEWTDEELSNTRDTWYFDPATSLWAQESRWPLFDEDTGVKIRDAFYEDKYAILWDVDNSVEAWPEQTCFATCHTGLSEADGYARHYTLGAGQTVDMWHWKQARTSFYQQADDQYQDDVQPNGRHSDANDGQAPYTNNSQTLNNGIDDVSVPLYFIPGREYYNWITIDEINSGEAKLITGVDATGILTYDGGTIDPNTEEGYERDGETTGKFGMPSVWVQPSNGSRGDITAVGVYTGTGWILEFKRKLSTGDATGADVDFSSLEDFPFGIATFNNAAIAHATRAFLTLKFEEE